MKDREDYNTPHLIATHTYDEFSKFMTAEYLYKNELPLFAELTGGERQRIKSQCDAFWDDVRFKVYKTALIIYVDSSRCDFEYVHCIGVYETEYIAGRKLHEALNCAEYSHRSKHSAKRGSPFLLYGGYKFSTLAEIEERCEGTIAYFLNNQIEATNP